MNETDRKVRLFVFKYFADHGKGPETTENVKESFQRLHEEHVLVMRDNQIVMMMPFSAVPTNYRVVSGSQSWWANCGWDALGIPVALKREVEISSNCPDCGEQIKLKATGSEVIGNNEVLYVGLPLRKWWEDIFFT